MRDNQKARVYRAERELDEWVWDARRTPDPRLGAVPNMKAYVNRVTAYAWFERQFGAGWTIEVQDGRSRRKPGGINYGPRRGGITIPRWGRSELIVLHELAHALTAPDEHHGPTFMAAYILLVEKMMGADIADRLRAACRAHNVDWSWSRRAA